MATPKLRFKEFDGDWILEEIKKVFTNKSESFNPLKNENLPCVELEHLSQNTGQIIGTVNSIDQQSTKNLFESNSVLYGKLRPYLRKFANPQFKGVCSSEIWVLTGIKISNDYLFQFVQSEQFSELTNIQSGSKMPRADWNLIADAEIEYPSKEEQTKLASFLSAVDEKISQLTQKHELLSQYKQGMMQKLFSQQIRFKADDGTEFGEWKSTTLGKVAEIIGGGTPSTDNEEYWNGNVIWLTPSEINKKFISESKRTISELGVQKSSAKKLPVGTILFTSRATIGEVSIATQEVTTNQGFQSFLTNSNTFNEFLYYWIIQNKKKFIERASGSTFLEISKSKIQPMEILLPCLNEQAKIANFLSAIDQKIEVVAQQIEQAKTWKKGLLQQMFV